MLYTSEPVIKRLISHKRWLDLLNDHRDIKGVAIHFGMSVEDLEMVLAYWEIK